VERRAHPRLLPLGCATTLQGTVFNNTLSIKKCFIHLVLVTTLR
jgi:hypothetical protein